ncbi:hypothetical protein [Streptomyces sp. TP-A0356]|uniref:hypothetical protein n=1 Tax=Streptomyces sp. TP-A0356 TaxID=1359208 RepID=UPI0006E4057F|nr:hypothetical protein [Streptomyces sp. TP-A0356]
MEQSDTTLTPLSVLRMGPASPPTPEVLAFLDFTLTISNAPGGGGPMVVSTLQPAQLLAPDVPQFPPQNLLFNLLRPVPLGPPGADPNSAPVVLQGFPVTLNQT